jgi:catalase-peroxidase
MKFSIVALSISQLAAFSDLSAGSALTDCPMLAKRNLKVAQDRALADDLKKRQVAAIADFQKVKVDIIAALTNSNPDYPADFGNYGPFFVRLAWHCSGTLQFV